MKHKRIIYIDPALAQEASASKEALDALALVLSMKVTFVDSCVRNATAVNVMGIFGIGHARYKRAVEYGLKRGWLQREGNNLAATKIKAIGAYNIRLVFTKHYYALKRTPNNIKAVYTLTQMCNFIRQAVILFHISKQDVVYDTITMADHPSSQIPRNLQKRAAKRAKGWGMCRPTLRRDGNRLSYARMSQLASCSKSKAKALVGTLLNNGIIDRHENYVPTALSMADYNLGVREEYARCRFRGFLIPHRGKVMIRLANSYSLCSRVVKFVKDYRNINALECR